MASSDNVIRAGFTPKFKDVDNLTSCLTYSYAPISEQKMSPTPYPYVQLNGSAYTANSSALLYDPPIEEFSVVRLELKGEGARASFEGIEGPSVIICTKGSGKIKVGNKEEEIKEGYVFFVGATAEVVVEGKGGEGLVLFKAFCELESEQENGSKI
jgi:mannose-6-phosphate isomerase